MLCSDCVYRYCIQEGTTLTFAEYNVQNIVSDMIGWSTTMSQKNEPL